MGAMVWVLGWSLAAAGGSVNVAPDVLALMPPQGDAQKVQQAAAVLGAAVERWSRWPRVPPLQVDALNLVEGGPALLSCLGEDTCALAAARAMQARRVLFVRFSGRGVAMALFDAVEKKTTRAAADEDSPRAVELVVARLLDPAHASGVVEAPGQDSLMVDGARRSTPVALEAGPHVVRWTADAAEETVWVPPGGTVVLQTPTAQARGVRSRWPGVVLAAVGVGCAVASLPVLLGAGAFLGGALERRWTASQPQRLGGSAALGAFVEWQAVMMERGALVLAGLGAALAVGAVVWGVAAAVTLVL